MTTIITLDTGDSYELDRGLYVSKVADQINQARGEGQLIPFENNATPSRIFYIDPDHVVAIRDNGYRT